VHGGAPLLPERNSLPERSILIVDKSAETREVLRTALQKRGTRVLEANRAEEGLELARQHRPDLIVLDLEIDAENAETIPRGFGSESQEHHTPMVLLGNARRMWRNFPEGEFVAKPYHYGPLIRRIEKLLEDVRQPILGQD
jgi:PleD family two-component response regulator